jgi:hypothetical protein
VTAFDLAWAPPPSRCFTVSGGQFVAAEREEERTEANDSVCSFDTAMIEPHLTSGPHLTFSPSPPLD